MNKDIVKGLVGLKLALFDEVSKRLPGATGEKINRVEYEFMAALNEATGEYLEKTRKSEIERQIKKVPVD